MELKICISPQFRAIDPPNPARGFIQQNENVRFATAACMQKYGNVSFATVACAKCMRYGGRGGGTHTMGGGGGGNTGHGTIYIFCDISPKLRISEDSTDVTGNRLPPVSRSRAQQPWSRAIGTKICEFWRVIRFFLL